MNLHSLRPIFAALFTTTIACYGQQPMSTGPSAASCPVTITHINPSGDDSFGHAFGRNAHANDGRMFVLKVQNSSGKDIKGMKFQASYYDATEDLTNIPVSWEWTDPLKASEEKSFRWENLWKDQSKVGWKVRLTKVLYQDGSRWEPSEGQVCSADYWRDKHHT